MLERVKIDPEVSEQSWDTKAVLPWAAELICSGGQTIQYRNA